MKKVWIAAVGLSLLWNGAGQAQEKKHAPQARPAIVVLDDITEGRVQPQAPFVGTLFFSRVSNVAAEVDGRVEKIEFAEGHRVEKGRRMAALNTDLLDLGIAQKQALFEEAGVELAQARKDMERMEKLYREKSVAYTVFDDVRFKSLALEKKVVALEASLARDRLLKKKMNIRAPFSGLVLKKEVEVGEWVDPGSAVAVVAADREIDAVVEVPQTILPFLSPEAEFSVSAGGSVRTGRLEAVIPKGDVATRTFSVKIRLINEGRLLEGMEAEATLPTGEPIEGLLVHRDAIISQFGRDVIFVAVEGAAKMVPVNVPGYHGLMAGVEGPGLSAGMKVVVKGNERLREGQPLMPQ